MMGEEQEEEEEKGVVGERGEGGAEYTPITTYFVK